MRFTAFSESYRTTRFKSNEAFVNAEANIRNSAVGCGKARTASIGFSLELGDTWLDTAGKELASSLHVYIARGVTQRIGIMKSVYPALRQENSVSYRADIDPDGYFDVVAHGSPNKIQIETPNGPALVDHRAAARLIKQQPGYNGQNIRLFSCSTGACNTGFAQNLANKLNVEVQAPTDLLWAYSNGKTLVAPKAINGQPDISNLGKIKVFLPKRSQ
jgi:hypothetical protein